MKGNISPEDAKLFEKYASIFPDKDVISDPAQSCLAWGIECGDGWRGIIEQACTQLSMLSNVQVQQIKSKYGTMRFYLEGPEEAHCIAGFTERASEKICEDCGQPGHLVKSDFGWYSTLCEECNAKREKR